MTISRLQALKPTSRLQAVFYVIMTDHLPVGTLAQVVDKIAQMPFDDLQMENALLGQYARDLADAVGT
jgi:hypothetical protein